MRREECDVLVAGHGAAGCIAGARLAARGLKVTVIGCGTPATALSTGRIAFPGGTDQASGPLGFLREHGAPWGLFRERGQRAAWTNLGTVSTQSLSSGHDWLAEDRDVAALGLAGDPDLDPDLLRSAAARSRGAEIASYWTGPAGWRSQGPDEVVDALSEVLRDLPQEKAVLPPLFPGRDWSQALDLLERKSGRKVLEAMTPLSAPGQRLQGCLEDAAVRCGCTLRKDRRLADMEMDGREAVSATVASGIREVRFEMKAVVLACGNLVGGGLAVDASLVREPLLGLSTREARRKGVRSLPLRRALATGVEVREGKAVTAEGRRSANIFVAGSLLPGMSYPLGKGLGPVIVSAWEAAEAVGEAL